MIHQQDEAPPVYLDEEVYEQELAEREHRLYERWKIPRGWDWVEPDD
jgi:hypothetical protein